MTAEIDLTSDLDLLPVLGSLVFAIVNVCMDVGGDVCNVERRISKKLYLRRKCAMKKENLGGWKKNIKAVEQKLLSGLNFSARVS